jgi:hypothetical protein
MGIRRKSVEERVAEPSGERLQDECEPHMTVEEMKAVDAAWVLASAARIFHEATKAKDYMAAMDAVELIAQVIGCLDEPAGENREPKKKPVH